VTESMGAITDHSFEHLGPSDQMIARTRRRLIQAARALRDKKTSPPGVADPGVFRGARSGYFISGESRPWQEIYARRLAEAVRPAEERRAAD
jgi:phthalate 4,5-dioxygenase oxygenase subunit